MKIAMPLTAGKLSGHFGHCEVFAFIEVDRENRRIISTEFLKPPPHEPGVMPGWTAEHGADLVIGGGMGTRARQLFTQHGVDVIVGAPVYEPEKIAQAWLDGTLQTAENACDH